MEFTTKYRGRFVIRAVQPFIAPGSAVLDIGCGNGVISCEISKVLGCRLVGTDILDYTRKAIEFKKMTRQDSLDFDDGAFDVALFVESLHHMPLGLQLSLIREALRVAPQVLVYEVEPNRLVKFFDYWLNQFHNPDMPFTFAFRSKGEWLNLFRENGIPVELGIVKKPFLGLWFTCHLFCLKRPNTWRRSFPPA
jgi:SAM-dependent methyltransferase